jgi:GAF domain-containing protein
VRLDKEQILASASLAPARGDVAELGQLAMHPSVERAVAVVRDFLGMDVAYATEFADGQQHFRLLRGDGDSFGVHEGLALPLEQTYCQQILDGRLPNLIPDVRADERAASLPASEAADVGAFASVPITLSDGQLYGTLCAASHTAQPSLEHRDLQFLRVFARIIADQIEHEQQQQQNASSLAVQANATSALLAALAARDDYTQEQRTAVADLAVRIAGHLGLDERATEQVRQAALL